MEVIKNLETIPYPLIEVVGRSNLPEFSSRHDHLVHVTQLHVRSQLAKIMHQNFEPINRQTTNKAI